MKIDRKIYFFSLFFLLFSFFLNAQQIGIDFFYCPNTLAPSYFDDSEGKPIQIEIALNEKANTSNLNLYGTLMPNISLVNITALPSNFSNVIFTTFQLTDGVNLRDVNMSAKRINKRNAPFTLGFTERFQPSDWIRSTTGWTSIGVNNSVSGNIELTNEGALFFLAFNKDQELLSFDISGINLQAFSGEFTVETSNTGVDDWEPLIIIDNCFQKFKSDSYRIFLKMDLETQYVRFSTIQSEPKQPIYLNNFSVGAYNGEDLDNFTTVPKIANQSIFLKSNFVKNEISIIGLEKEQLFSIYSILGNKIASGKIHLEPISITSLLPGTYFLKLFENKDITLKFIKY